jgi:hypothetical protein
MKYTLNFENPFTNGDLIENFINIIISMFLEKRIFDSNGIEISNESNNKKIVS